MDDGMGERAAKFNKSRFVDGLDYVWDEERAIAFAKAEVDRQREALTPYLKHWASCRSANFETYECACGLLQAIRAAKE